MAGWSLPVVEDRVSGRKRWLIVPLVLIGLLGLGILYLLAPHPLLPRLFGTGGYALTTVRDAPHPYAFERPRLWIDDTDSLHRGGQKWDALIVGPVTDLGVFHTRLGVHVRPEFSRAGDYPMPGGPITSFDDFVSKFLPSGAEVVAEATRHVDGRPALDMLYDFSRSDWHRPANPRQVPGRGRSLFFEDRGYYYELEYEARDAEYERYAEI
jgi:hypothetical protein